MVFHSPEFTGHSFTLVHLVSRRARGTTQELAFSLRMKTSVEGEADTSLSPWTVRGKVKLLRTLCNARMRVPEAVQALRLHGDRLALGVGQSRNAAGAAEG